MERFIPFLAIPLITASAAVAAPFKLTPESFRFWLNATRQTSWESVDRIYFESLSKCRYTAYSNSYECWKSFVRVTDPRGSRICTAGVYWEGDRTRDDGTTSFGKGVSVRNISECRWLKDPRFVDN